MSQDEFDFSAPPPVMFQAHRVRKTITHKGSERRRQHVYLRLTDEARREYNRCIGGFKHFLGADTNGAVVFERYGLPAMMEALKALAARGQTA